MQKEDSRVGEGPLKIGVSPLRARGAIACARRCRGTRHEAAVGHEVLDTWEAVDRRHFVSKDQTQHLADPRHGLASVQGLGVVRLGGLDHRQFKVAEEAVVVRDAREVHLDTVLYGRIRTALGDALTVRLVGDVLAEGRQVLRARRLLDMGEEFCPLAHPRHATPEEVAGGPPISRIDVGLGEPAAAE